MSKKEDDVDEENIIEEGRCDGCDEYIIGPELTKCPESNEEVKDNCLMDHFFCRDCCKEALDNHDCEGSCEKDFVEEYRKSKKKR